MKEVIEKEKKQAKDVKCQALVPIKKIKPLALKMKNNKTLGIVGKIVLKIFKIVLKVTIIIAIYAVVFWVALYFSNRAMVDKLRQTEKNEEKGPVLTIIRPKEKAQEPEQEPESEIETESESEQEKEEE